MDIVIAIVVSIIVGILVSCLAAWVFTFTPLGWTFGQYFALAVGISIASWQAK